MSEPKRYIPFWTEVLLHLLLPMAMLAFVLYALTEEFLRLILMFASVVVLTPGVIWIGIKEYKSRLGKGGLLGFLLLCIFNFILLGFLDSMTEWIWVKLCLVLLGGGLMLHDIASKRNISNEELEE